MTPSIFSSVARLSRGTASKFAQPTVIRAGPSAGSSGRTGAMLARSNASCRRRVTTFATASMLATVAMREPVDRHDAAAGVARLQATLDRAGDLVRREHDHH